MKTRPRRPDAHTCHGGWFAALASVCLVLVALPVAACSSTPASPAAGFVGYDWQVVTIGHDGTTTSIPASQQVSLRFSPDGQFGANDGVNFHSGGMFRTTRGGFTFSDMSAASTAAGYAGHDPTVVLAISAIGSFYFGDGDHATAKVTGDRLVVGVGPFVLTCQRHGRQADIPIGPPLQ